MDPYFVSLFCFKTLWFQLFYHSSQSYASYAIVFIGYQVLGHSGSY